MTQKTIMLHHGISQDRFEELLNWGIDPAHWLNTAEQRSFVLPETDSRYVTFEDLKELSPNDVVYHGTTEKKLHKIKKSGIVDPSESHGQIYVTTVREKAENYARNRAIQDGSHDVLLHMKVADIPSGIFPPRCMTSNGYMAYYDVRDKGKGVGIVEKTIPFKDYIAEAV